MAFCHLAPPPGLPGIGEPNGQQSSIADSCVAAQLSQRMMTFKAKVENKHKSKYKYKHTRVYIDPYIYINAGQSSLVVAGDVRETRTT